MSKIKIRMPDDFHVHLREGHMLQQVIVMMQVINRVVAMGNLKNPIVKATDVTDYLRAIKTASNNPRFEPIMSIMLTNATTPQIIKDAFAAGARVLKLIPGGTSTNAGDGVSLPILPNYYPCLEMAENLGMIFSMHLELIADPVNNQLIPEVQREAAAIHYFSKVVETFPDLKIIFEHATTARAIALVAGMPENVGATLTAHHTILTVADVLDESGKVKHNVNFCKPVAKTFADQQAVIEAMTSGDPHFIFGSDLAPHPWKAKGEGAAGIFCPPTLALPLLAQVFEEANALPRLEAFVSEHGARFYGLPLNEETIGLVKKDWVVPSNYEGIPYFVGGQTLPWQWA